MRRIVRFSADSKLFGAWHVPGGPARGGVVMCAPFGEEAKSVYRTFYETADLLASRGWHALRFDYFGTGNSLGSFEEFTPTQARHDIRAAVIFLRGQGVEKIGLLGLGLGGSLAFAHAAEEHADFLVLWQPCLNGEEFYRLNIKRQLVRQMLTHGKATGAATRGDVVDLDGYAIRKSTVEELRKLNLLNLCPANIPPTLLLQISYSGNMSSELQALADSCRPAPEMRAVVCEPFWKRIGFVECGQVLGVTASWLEALRP